MKRILWMIAAVVAVSAGVSFGVARWAVTQRTPPTAGQLQDAAWLKRALNLTADQARTVEAMDRTFQAQLATACASHCAARFALGDELMKPTVDADRCKACVEKMNAAQADSERVTLAHILAVRGLLDRDQARHYSSLIHDQVCNMPMGTP